MQTVCKLRYVDGFSRRARLRNLIAPLRYDADRIDIPHRFLDQVREALDSLSDRQNVTVRFIGHTDSQPLADREERIY